MNRFLCVTATVLLAGTASAETLSMDGDSTGTFETIVTEVSKGHLVMMTNSNYNGFTVTDSPMADSSGNCRGTMEMLAGKLSGGGHCVYTDADGDTWVINWVPDAMSDTGAVEGTWTLTGGSGKYSGATGRGTFSNLSNQETGKFVNTTTGSVKLK